MKKNFYGPGINSIEGTTWKFNNNISNQFDKHVRQSIPHYDGIQDYVCSLSEWFIKENSIVYDLGCSTGETAKNLFSKYPKKKFNYVGYDLSTSMIKIAKKRNKKYLKNAKFSVANINNINFKKSDLFLSILTFPFLNSNARIKLFKKIYRSLNFGGSLIFIDKVRASESVYEDIFNQIYFDFKIDKKLKHEQILNKAKSIRSSMQIFQINQIEGFLKEAGFKNYELFFRWYNFVGFLAIK